MTTRLDAGLSALRRLASPEEWATAIDEEGLNAVHTAAEALRAFVAEGSDDSAQRRELNARVEVLLQLILTWDGAWTPLPPDIEETARESLRPVLVISGTDSTDGHSRSQETPPGRFAPARAMAVGGAATDSFGGGSDEDTLDDIVRTLLEESGASAAFLVDRVGHTLAIAGDENPPIQRLRRVWPAGSTPAFLRTGHETRFLNGENVHVQLAWDRRLLLGVAFEGQTSLGLVRLAMKRAVPKAKAVFASLAARLNASNAMASEDDVRWWFEVSDS